MSDDLTVTRAENPASPGSSTVPLTSVIQTPVDRRWVLGTGGKAIVGATATAAGVGAVREAFYPPYYKLALLKMDTATHKLALVHRSLSINDKTGMLETAKESAGELDALTVEPDGLESVVLSPDLLFRSKANLADPQNIDGTEDNSLLSIKNPTKNLYLPYHLLDHTANLTIHRDGTKIALTFESKQEAKVLTPLERATIDAIYAQEMLGYKAAMAEYGLAIAAYEAKKQANGWGDWVLDELGNPGGWGKGDPAPEAVPVAPNEPSYPTPSMVTATFTITFDAPDVARLPDIHFYNGKTLENPSFTVPREDIAKALLSPEGKLSLLRSELQYSADHTVITDKNGNPDYKQHFMIGLDHGVDAAQRCRECSSHDGLILWAWDAGKKMLVQDNSLPKTEIGALRMATSYQSAKREERGRGNWLTQAGAFMEKHAILTGAISDQNPGR